MALRLTDTSSPAPTASTIAPGAALVERARTALAVGDLDTYRALAAETAELADVHRRYVTRRSLIDLGLVDARRPVADTPAVLLATADVALTVLAPDPAEPVLLNLTGVALFQLGAQRGAEAVFRAAAALDPDVTNLKGNLDALAQLRKRRQTMTPPAAIARPVAELERRAVTLAGRATPATDASISLCMIVRDEEATLARALASARDVVDEIVVVDTGSQDRTVEVAREHGAKILTHAWDDDFAAARNVGLEAATGDWILFLDADEVLVAEDAPKLRTLARRTWREGFALTIVNRVGDDDGASALTQEVLRLFRNRPQHRFEGRIHESVLQCLPGDAPERVETAGVRIDHDGYLDSVRAGKDKSRRNLELLERQLAESTPTAYLEFNLGSEYLAAGEPATAAAHLQRAWALLLAEQEPAQAMFGPALATRCTSALRLTGSFDEAIAVAERALTIFDGFTDLLLEQALASLGSGDDEVAETLLRRCLELGDASARHAAVTGAGTFLAATALAHLHILRGEVAEAHEVLSDVVAEHPHHQPAHELLAFTQAALDDAATLPAGALALLASALDARLAAVDIDGFVALVPLTERVEGLGPRERRELLACLYLDRGFLDSAADEWAAACEAYGPDAAALTGLSRIAAARGNHEDAEVFAEGARELAGQSAA